MPGSSSETEFRNNEFICPTEENLRQDSIQAPPLIQLIAFMGGGVEGGGEWRGGEGRDL